MKISLSRAMFETRHEFESVKRMLREAEGEPEDDKAGLKKKALVTVRTQGQGFQELAAKMTKAGMPQAGAAMKVAGDTLISLSTEKDLDEEGVGKFVSARTLGASLANFFSGLTSELASVGEDSAKKTLADILSDKGVKALEQTISLNLVPSPAAAKLLKTQNSQFAEIFKKEEPDTEDASDSDDKGTSASPEAETGADTKVKESEDVFEMESPSLSEAGLGSMFADLIKKFLGSPPKSAKQTVELVSPLLGGKNMAKLLLADMKKTTYEQYENFIPAVKKIFVVVNPAKQAPLPPTTEEGESGSPDAASKGAQVAADNPELVDRISDEAKKRMGDSSAAAMEALRKIASGVDKREAVAGLDADSLELLKPLLAKLGAEGANANAKNVVKAVAGTTSESEGQTLSSVLFQSKSTKKKKLGDKGTSIDSAIRELAASWETYSKESEFKAPLKKDIVSKFKTMKDVLSDVKTENALRQEEIIIERWQRLAGIK